MKGSGVPGFEGPAGRKLVIGTVAAACVLVLALLIVAAASIRQGLAPSSSDFDVGGPVGESGPIKPGQVIWIGTNALNVATDVHATLVSLTPLGLPGDIAAETLFMPLAGTEGALGEMPDSAVPASNRQIAGPLRDAVVSSSDGYFQLLVRFVLPPDGITVHGYVLTYEVGGDTRQVYIPRSQHICASVAPGAQCENFEPHP